MWRDLKLPRPDLLLKFFQVLTVVPDEYDAVALTEGFYKFIQIAFIAILRNHNCMRRESNIKLSIAS
jgi:hypothetical protein